MFSIKMPEHPDFEKYLNSKEYSKIEYDEFYKELVSILTNNLPEDIYLNIEELLHAEILFKLEQGFIAGFNSKI